MRQRTGSTPRAGFTLIELLVVITIIAILVGLTIAGVGRARHEARRVQTVKDIHALDAAVTEFKTKFGFAPPSHIVETATDGNRYLRRFQPPLRIDQPEYQVFRRMYPRWNPVDQGGLAADNVTILPAFRPARAGEVLDGNQVLVYFLGGPTNQGWSNAGPVAPTGNTKINPIFEFPVGDQLVAVGTAAPRFLDLNGIPYAYFTSNTDNDRFDERAQFPWTSGGTRSFGAWGTGIEVAPATFDPATDPFAAGTNTVHPLRSPGGKWLAAGRWQIIGAGKDKKFGYGSPMHPSLVILDYTPGVGAYDLKQPGDDDISNFSGSNLGVQ